MKLKLSNTKKRHEWKPATVIAGTFLLVIAIGTLLLTLPVSSRDGSFTPLLSSMFTATTSTCVTGLVVVDTYSHWSLFGQLVILLLIQIGGIGLVTITTFFFMMLGKKMGFQQLVLATEAVNTSSLNQLKKLVRLVIAFTGIIEAAGAVILSARFITCYGYTPRSGVWTGIFTSVSAYCNAGIDLFGRPDNKFTSLTQFRFDPVVNFTIMALIVLGGIGFIVYKDLLQYKKTKRLMLHTRIVLLSTVLLIIFGFVSILLFEWDNPATLESMNTPQRIMAALFQSVTTRTAGFNTVDLNALRDPTKIVMSILMFIGAAPGSTAGGIKVTTLVVIIATVLSTLRNRQHTVIMGRRISHLVVYKAYSIAMLGALIPIILTVIIYLSNINMSLVNCIFESFSAMGTVGLSAGLTPQLSDISKIAVMVTMFIGRVGPFSFFMALSVRSKHKTATEVLPEGQIMVG